MADCPVCGQMIGTRDVNLMCRHAYAALYSEGHPRNCAERLSYELIEPTYRDGYNRDKKSCYFCKREDDSCLREALSRVRAREDVRAAMALSKTDKTAAIQALKQIMFGLRDSQARDQISRAINTL